MRWPCLKILSKCELKLETVSTDFGQIQISLNKFNTNFNLLKLPVVKYSFNWSSQLFYYTGMCWTVAELMDNPVFQEKKRKKIRFFDIGKVYGLVISDSTNIWKKSSKFCVAFVQGANAIKLFYLCYWWCGKTS